MQLRYYLKESYHSGFTKYHITLENLFLTFSARKGVIIYKKNVHVGADLDFNNKGQISWRRFLIISKGQNQSGS